MDTEQENTIVGEMFQITVHSTRKSADDPEWEILGEARFALTEDGERWVQTSFPVKAVDTDLDNGTSTVMLSISNFINANGVHDSLIKALRENKDGGEESESSEADGEADEES